MVKINVTVCCYTCFLCFLIFCFSLSFFLLFSLCLYLTLWCFFCILSNIYQMCWLQLMSGSGLFFLLVPVILAFILDSLSLSASSLFSLSLCVLRQLIVFPLFVTAIFPSCLDVKSRERERLNYPQKGATLSHIRQISARPAVTQLLGSRWQESSAGTERERESDEWFDSMSSPNRALASHTLSNTRRWSFVCPWVLNPQDTEVKMICGVPALGLIEACTLSVGTRHNCYKTGQMKTCDVK